MYLGNIPQDQYLSVKSQQITGNGGSSYSLDYAVSTSEDIAVFVNNVRQNVSTYSVSSTTLTLGGTISASDECWVLFLGRTVGTKTPAVGSVTNDMLAGSIANAKLANSSITLNGSAVSLGGSASVANTPAFEAYISADATLSNNVFTKVAHNTEVYDTDGCYDNTTNYRFTPTTAGKYYIYAAMCATSINNLYQTIVNITKNGSSVREALFQNGTNASYPINRFNPFISAVLDMNGTTDYVESFANIQTHDGTNVLLEGAGYTYFGGYRIIGA